MDPRLALVALATLLLVPTPVLAQDASAEPTLLMEDDGGDVAAYASAGADAVPTTVPAGTYDNADLLSLSVSEAPSEFQFHIALKTLDGGATEDVLASIQYSLTFRHVDNLYRVRIYGFGNQYSGSLELMSASPDEPFGSYV